MDLLHIPGDTGGGWRIKKFGEFAHKVRAVDPLMLEEYYRRHNLSLDTTLDLFWLLSSTYSEITAIVILNQLKRLKDHTPEDINSYWKEYKPLLKFGSSRRYAKSLDWFPHLIQDWNTFTHKSPSTWFKSFLDNSTPAESYRNLYKFLESRKFMGRFSVELFLLNFTYFRQDKLWNIELSEATTFNWREYSNETSGLLNLFYMDEKADEFDKSHTLDQSTFDFLNKANSVLQTYLKDTYGEYDAQPLIYMPRICTFRNFCKERRYVGFHHDRQLSFIKNYEKHFGVTPLIKEFYDIRKSIYPIKLLGELNGWLAPRSALNHTFLRTGFIGVEEI